MQVPVLSARGIYIGFLHMCYCFSRFVFRNHGYNLDFPREIDVFYENKKCIVLCWFLCEIFDRVVV